MSEKFTHVDYKRVTEYATLLKNIITGENLDDLLHQFNIREDEVLFAQRKLLTNHIVKPLARAALKPINKIPRVSPVVDTISYESESKEKVKQLKDIVKTMYGGESVDAMLQEMFPEPSSYDPNSFLLTVFNNDFDHTKEKPKVYSTIITSFQAVDFNYFNNELEYLVAKGDHLYPKNEAGKIIYVKGDKYQIYIQDWCFELTQIDGEKFKGSQKGIIIANQVVLSVDGKSEETKNIISCEDGRAYVVNEFNTKSKFVPAERMGYILDPMTDGRTCISILDNAIPFFRKTIKAVSEMDLSMSLHVFPQKLLYVPKCPGAENDSCKNGLNRQGTKCSVCGGTGKSKVATSSQDTIEIALPDEKNLDKVFDLTKLVHYVAIPVEGLKFQKEYIDWLKEDLLRAIYNSDTYIRDTTAETATKRNLDMESVYDTLYPAAMRYGRLRSHVIKVTAAYHDIAEGLVIDYQQSKDFKFKTLPMLLDDLKLVNESQGASFIRDQINKDIASNIFKDRPKEILKLEKKQLFYPFNGYSDVDKAFALSSPLCKKETKVLFIEFSNIFTELEQEAERTGLYLYDYTYEVLKSKIDDKVKKIIDQIDSQQINAIQFDPKSDPNPADPAKL